MPSGEKKKANWQFWICSLQLWALPTVTKHISLFCLVVTSTMFMVILFSSCRSSNRDEIICSASVCFTSRSSYIVFWFSGSVWVVLGFGVFLNRFAKTVQKLMTALKTLREFPSGWRPCRSFVSFCASHSMIVTLRCIFTYLNTSVTVVCFVGWFVFFKKYFYIEKVWARRH